MIDTPVPDRVNGITPATRMFRRSRPDLARSLESNLKCAMLGFLAIGSAYPIAEAGSLSLSALALIGGLAAVVKGGMCADIAHYRLQRLEAPEAIGAAPTPSSACTPTV